MLAVANKFKGKPIAFIAVNSGNSKASVQQYVRANKITWPVIVDQNRSFEKAIGVKEISLNNIWNTVSINASGNVQGAGDLKSTADRLLKDAKWNVDPSALPDSLQAVWASVEFGDYPSAAKTLNRVKNSKSEEVKAGATLLLDHVNQKLDDSLKLAAQAKEDGKIWSAYKEYLVIDERFKGYETDIDVKSITRELKSDPTVVSEITAKKRYDAAQRTFVKLGMKRTLVSLKILVEKYPDTEAAAAAQKIIDSQPE